MKTCSEMRREAFGLLGGGWLWRILSVALVLQTVGNAVIGSLADLHGEMGIVRIGDFWKKKMQAWQQGLEYTLPTSADYWRMTGAGLMENFFMYLFGAILLYGVASVLLKALNRDNERWFADSMGGFRRPLGVAWLMLLQNLRVLLWTLLFIVPGIVALYRYRQAWYVKNEHPDWSAAACLAESGRLMRGCKLKALLFDLSYLGWFALVIVALMPMFVISAVCDGDCGIILNLLQLASVLFGVGTLLFALVYYSAGRVVFYRETKVAHPPCPVES